MVNKTSFLISITLIVFFIVSTFILNNFHYAINNKHSQQQQTPNIKFQWDSLNKPKNRDKIDIKDYHNSINLKDDEDNNNPYDRTTQVYKDNLEMNKYRQNRIRNSMKFGWDSYVTYAWGTDELQPLTKDGKNWFHMGLSIVDGIDTLLIMGLEQEYEMAYNWIKDKLNHRANTGQLISVFEANIRYLGAYLTLFQLTRDQLYYHKAVDMGNILLHSFDDNNPFPTTYLNFYTNVSSNPSWTGGCIILADAGTMFLELNHLSAITGDPIYKYRSDKILEKFDQMNKNSKGLYPTLLRQSGDSFCTNTLTMGGMADSFYEYLIKMWIYSDETDPQHDRYRKMYLESAEGIIRELYKTTPKGDSYLDHFEGYSSKKMEHLACMAGGMFSLGVVSNITGDDKLNAKHMEVAERVTETCVKFYTSTQTGLAADSTIFDDQGGFNIYTSTTKANYYLRPETVESLFYLYRFTGDTKYQEWGWHIYEAIEKHCRGENGYSGLSDVNNPNSKDNVQQSYFLAETFKYLYLLFSDSSLIPLDKYVFNTEAHPIPIPHKLKI